MRLIALCGLLAVATPLSPCERPRTDICTLDPEFKCADGKICSIPAGETTGTCGPPECIATSNTCPDARPICVNSRCVACQGNSDCQGLNNTAAPICSEGKCVGCGTNADCTSPTSPICDSGSHICRPCQTHGDCSKIAGVCAKDSTFASLSSSDLTLNIPQGSCVPSTRVNVVDPSCVTTTCSLATALGMVSVQRPYVRVGSVTTTTPVSVPTLPSGVPTFYIVGATADSAPSSTIPVAPSSITAGGTALLIPAGSHTIVEGLVMYNSNVGLDCAGTTATRVKLLRSLVGGCSTGIKAAARCELSIDSSWIGKAPPDPRLTIAGSGNALAMQLNSTQLEVVNSVFFHNGGPGNVFGGVSLTDSMGLNPLVRIVNTTFDNHLGFDTTRKVLAIDCNYATGGKMTLVNTIFLNSGSLGIGHTYVNGMCRQGANPFAGLASNDAALSCASCVTNADETIFADVTPGDLHLSASAPTSITAGGTTQFNDTVGKVTIPLTDMDGATRGDAIAIGAFEPSP